MQNEPNFGKAQMNVNKVLTKDYEEKCGKDLWKNEPKTNPIKANFKTEDRKQMTAKSGLTKDYNNEQRTMNNERLCKTNTIKNNQNQKTHIHSVYGVVQY